MKFACLSDTLAPPICRPLSPACSMRRPAKSPGGLRNTEPQLGNPSGCAALRRASSSLIASIELDSSCSKRNVPPRNHSVAGPAHASDSRSRTRRAAARERRRGDRSSSTLSTCVHVSPPNAPAFIASAPPTVPGMPAKNAAGPELPAHATLGEQHAGEPGARAHAPRRRAARARAASCPSRSRRRECRRRARAGSSPSPANGPASRAGSSARTRCSSAMLVGA